MTCICHPSERPEGNTGHSASCNRYNRKLETDSRKAAQKKASQKQIAKVSDKMALALKEYAKLRKEFLKNHPQCEVYPWLKSQDVHHQMGRSSIKLLLETALWIAVSREGHIYIETHPEEAKNRGWSYSRLATEPNNTI